MTLTLTIPDEISEAAYFGTTPLQRIERMVDNAHRFRIGKTQEQLEAEWREDRIRSRRAALGEDESGLK